MMTNGFFASCESKEISSNRTGKFVSSEFSYEDLGSEEVADNDHTWIEDRHACMMGRQFARL